MWWHHGSGSWVGWLFMTTWMIGIWVLVIGAALVLARSAGGRPASPVRPPEQILAERLATGDIDEQEYLRRLDALRAGERGKAGAS
jgi:putative membrane protein